MRIFIMPREAGEHRTHFPDKEARYQCWDSRDKFWACIDSGGTDESCKELRNKYTEHCPSTWVKHFDRKYHYLRFKEKMKYGYDPIDTTGTKNEG
ncbi:cytochrome c oxidase assembly factor 6 homolog isoform X1 [Portunus trituberculatus]|uniref:cytochrome c oxidase assembly factor 6 homolog isoform X1 n=2 Tax=Portunus trituberculatus TaxID=210409 RepID=UPI001E1CD2AF|nr:cytochrome c oxidase assembly factor 6 homolog isoform X1 [Portunus trituberculatus]